MHRVHDIAWGAFAVILVCGAAAAQLWRPERRPAAMQQLLACLAAGGISIAASGALVPSHLIRGAFLAVPAAVMLAMHPVRKDVLRVGRMSPLLAALAIVVAVPLVRFALEQVRIQRIDTVSPHGIAFHWGTMATLALSIVATMLVASSRAPGWRLSAWCAGAALAGLRAGVRQLPRPCLERRPGVGGLCDRCSHRVRRCGGTSADRPAPFGGSRGIRQLERSCGRLDPGRDLGGVGTSAYPSRRGPPESDRSSAHDTSPTSTRSREGVKDEPERCQTSGDAGTSSITRNTTQMVPSAGIGPATPGLGNRCSIH